MRLSNIIRNTLGAAVLSAALINPANAGEEKEAYQRLYGDEEAEVDTSSEHFEFGKKLAQESQKQPVLEEVLEERALHHLSQAGVRDINEAASLVIDIYKDDMEDFPDKKIEYLDKAIEAAEFFRKRAHPRDNNTRKMLDKITADAYFMKADALERDATFSSGSKEKFELAEELFKDAMSDYRRVKDKEGYLKAKERALKNEDHAEYMDYLDKHLAAANRGDTSSARQVGIELLKRRNYEAALDFFKRSDEKNGLVSLSEYMISSGKERKTPSGITESMVNSYLTKIKERDTDGLIDIMRKFAAADEIENETLLAVSHVGEKNWEKLESYGDELQVYFNKNSNNPDIDQDLVLNAARVFTDLAKDEDRRYMKVDLMKRAVMQYSAVRDGSDDKLHKLEAEKTLASLEEELEKYGADLPTLDGAMASVNVPEGAVLYMTFDEGTIAQKDGKWLVQDLSKEGNHGVIHGKFAEKDGEPVVFDKPEDVPEEYDLALVKGPSGKAGDYAMYFAGKGGYVVLPNSEGKGTLEDHFVNNSFEIGMDIFPIGEQQDYARILIKSDQKSPYPGVHLSFVRGNLNNFIRNSNSDKNLKILHNVEPNKLFKISLNYNLAKKELISILDNKRKKINAPAYDGSGENLLYMGGENIPNTYFKGIIDSISIK